MVGLVFLIESRSRFLPDGDGGFVAPLADAGVGGAVDGFVGPSRCGRWNRSGVGVAGGGVDGEEVEPFAIAAIDVDLDAFEVVVVALPTPGNFDLAAVDAESEVGFDLREVAAAAFGSDEAEGLRDGVGAVFMVAHAAGEGAEAADDAGQDSSRVTGRQSWHDRGGRSAGAAVAQVVFPSGPALGGVLHGGVKVEDGAEGGGVGGLLGDLGDGGGSSTWIKEFEGGEVGGDVIAEEDELFRFAVVVAGEVVLFSHSFAKLLRLFGCCFGGEFRVYGSKSGCLGREDGRF
jgi:hypothetical protein